MEQRYEVIRAALLWTAAGLVALALSLSRSSDVVDEPAEEPIPVAPSRGESTPDFAEVVPPVVDHVPLRASAQGPVVASPAQRDGVLSGRIVFMSAGHGLTADNLGSGAWETQRPLENQMVEDYGNIDQLNFFATWCFNVGATVVPLRPLGVQPNEVVLDNDSPSVVFTGGWLETMSSVYYGSPGDVPYRYAALAEVESATATYTPEIPVTGYYPVYTWVRHGADRGLQLYRILHAGGESTVRVPHHMVGNGWVYLGEYRFEQGANTATGSVVVSNLRGSEAGTVVVADAIRFGNGMGDLDRGGGVSGKPREDEAALYWCLASLGQGQPLTAVRVSDSDSTATVSTPARMSVEMNRELAGQMTDRIYIGMHSNKGGGSSRGTQGLYNGNNDPDSATPNQERLAQLCGEEVTDDLVALTGLLEHNWYDRPVVKLDYPSFEFGEINNRRFNDEMDATIIEVAFDDNQEDAELLRDPKARNAVGKAAMHAVVRYMHEFGGGSLEFPPESPGALRAHGQADGSVLLQWSPPIATGGSGSLTGFVVYRSQDGKGFGQPLELGNVTETMVTGLQPGVPHYFRVTAVNEAGESLPTPVVGCRISSPERPRVLVVNGFDRIDRRMNPRQTFWAGGELDRVMPRRSNAFDYTVAHGEAISAAGLDFDSCQNEEVASGAVLLSDYAVVAWACGEEGTADDTFDTAEQLAVESYLSGGGSLFVSGSDIGWDLDYRAQTTGDREFFNTSLSADYVADDANTYTVEDEPGGIFDGVGPFDFSDGSSDSYDVNYPDVIAPLGPGASVTMRYSSGGAAAVQAEGTGYVVYLAFPFECILDKAVRIEVMHRSLEFLAKPEGLVVAGSTWRYRDNGIPPPEGWTMVAYDDSGWALGPARLGYGGDGEQTTVDSGGIPSNVHPVTWFRHVFNAADAQAFDALGLEVQRDDGIRVFLNGSEILRDHLPFGSLPAGTYASTTVAGADEQAWHSFVLPASNLNTGPNVLAVQVHQAGAADGDLGFDLRLLGLATAAVDFSAWKRPIFGTDAVNPSLAGELSDPDSDGRVNLIEFACGTRPDNIDTGALLELERVGDQVLLRFPRNALATGVTWRLEAASDLQGSWEPIAMAVDRHPFMALGAGVVVAESPYGTVRTVEIHVNFKTAPPGRRFFRLAVTP